MCNIKLVLTNVMENHKITFGNESRQCLGILIFFFNFLTALFYSGIINRQETTYMSGTVGEFLHIYILGSLIFLFLFYLFLEG